MSDAMKYRVWHLEKKVMIYPGDSLDDLYPNSPVSGFAIDQSGRVCLVMYNYDPPLEPDANLIPMRFTGLTDRDGEEIYEGDVLEDVSGPTKRHAVLFGEGYHDGGYLKFTGWTVDPDNPHDGTNALRGGNYRVIGNIFEPHY